MKTAERIAQEAMWRADGDITSSVVERMIVAAITADRAQHSAEPKRATYETLGDLINEIRRMRDDGRPHSDVEYALSRVYPESEPTAHAQRDPNDDGPLHGAAISALRDRGECGGESSDAAHRAADWIEDAPDEFWDEFAGPMLDDLEARFRQAR
ncbi:MAG: hypothetical protein ACTH4Y_08150 [Microbacterium gubbeenense]|uniref:hypothetical protein n=1 Tax=Microbacterium gubbeenense TaxID=159896 RepID=UPI003F944BDD